MANEFIARRGFRALEDSQITGSLSITGNITGSTFSGSFVGDGSQLGGVTTASYVEYNNVANKPSLVSGSSQISFNGITDKPSLVSGSSQITYSELSGIPSGIVSGSSQVVYSGLTGIPSGIVSGSSQVSYTGLSNIPSGIVSGSAQITSLGYATTGSNTFQANQVITGSLFISQNLVVAGSSSIQYISSSVVDIADNIITVNAFNPGVRFGGLAVVDSGSSPQVSGSMLFDSIRDQWIFIHETPGAVTSSVVLMGPETYNNVGNETYLSANRLPKGSGIEHLRDSNITDTGTQVSVNSNTIVTGSFTVVTGSAVELQVTNLGVNLGSALTDSHIISGSLRVNPNGLFVSGSGNVGIGTTSPSDKLHVDGSIRVSSTNFFRYDGDTGLIGSGTSITGGTSSQLGIRAASDILFATSGANERMRITSGGNVGIGTTSPTPYTGGNVVLHINTSSTVSDIKLTNATSGTGATQGGLLRQDGNAMYLWNGSNGLLAFGTNNTERMRITAGGSVGIGTTSPDAIFHVALANAGGVGGQVVIDNPASSTLGNTAEISFLTDAGASGAGTRNARMLAVNENAGNGAANLQFHTWNGSASAERMRITSDGRVVQSNTAANSLVLDADHTSFTGRQAAFPGRFTIGPQGNSYPEIGYNFYTANSAYTKIANDTAWGISFGNSNRMDFRFAASGTGTFSWSNLMSINSNGTVGINITSPFSRLHVRDSTNEGTIAIGHETYPGLIYSSASTGEFRIDNRSSSSSGFISFYPNGQQTTLGNERMRISSAGQLLITADASNEQLVIRRASNNNLQLITGVHSSSYSWIQSIEQGVAYRPLVLNRDGGNVGIGTTSPAARLSVCSTTACSTVVDVQGCAGQLFSVTDNLVGEIFAVSDISGIPILSVNSNGTVSVDSKIAVGANHTVSGAYATVTGGIYSRASGACSTVSGGYCNIASGPAAVISGGYCNTSSCYNSTIGGGQLNSALSFDSTVSGGAYNTANAACSTVGGGGGNTASGAWSTVSGGRRNTASGNYSFVGGGSGSTPFGNTASGTFSVVAGGCNNTASCNFATVGGGAFNTASGYGSIIAGGRGNTASATYAAVLTGFGNRACFNFSSIGGGVCQTTSGCNEFRVCALSKASGTFRINHPDPSKKYTHYLSHSFVESPTAGDNIYRYKVNIVNGQATITLPSYYKYLNENDQIWVTPQGHFGIGYGTIDAGQTELTIYGNTDGEYNVLLIGTRKDTDAVEHWQGTETYK